MNFSTDDVHPSDAETLEMKGTEMTKKKYVLVMTGREEIRVIGPYKSLEDAEFDQRLMGGSDGWQTQVVELESPDYA